VGPRQYGDVDGGDYCCSQISDRDVGLDKPMTEQPRPGPTSCRLARLGRLLLLLDAFDFGGRRMGPIVDGYKTTSSLKERGGVGRQPSLACFRGRGGPFSATSVAALQIPTGRPWGSCQRYPSNCQRRRGCPAFDIPLAASHILRLELCGVCSGNVVCVRLFSRGPEATAGSSWEPSGPEIQALGPIVAVSAASGQELPVIASHHRVMSWC